jgi:hypothetical protein
LQGGAEFVLNLEFSRFGSTCAEGDPAASQVILFHGVPLVSLCWCLLGNRKSGLRMSGRSSFGVYALILLVRVLQTDLVWFCSSLD